MTTMTTTVMTTTAVPSPPMVAATTDLSIGGLVTNRSLFISFVCFNIWHIFMIFNILALITIYDHQVDTKVLSAMGEKSGGYDEQACLQAFDAVTTELALFATRSSEDKRHINAC